MKYLFAIIAITMFGCKKDPGTITWTLTKGYGDIVITDGDLVTDFQSCTEGWMLSRKAKPQTRYTIFTHPGKIATQVVIKYNGKVVAKDPSFAVYTTP